jgi:hypothetical protein
MCPIFSDLLTEAGVKSDHPAGMSPESYQTDGLALAKARGLGHITSRRRRFVE